MEPIRPRATGLAHDATVPIAPFGERAIAVEPGLDEQRMVVNFGPQHPATHGTLRLVLHLEGERVSGSSPRSASSTPGSRSSASRGRTTSSWWSPTA